MHITTKNWRQVRKALEEVEKRQEMGHLPFTCFYRKEGELIGSYFCGDEQEGDFVLFINKDYPDPVFVINLINQHCQFLNDEVKVYTLDKKGTELYKMVKPKSSIFVDL